MQSRRDFLSSMSMLTAGLMLPWNAFGASKDKFGQILPLRKLGKTGEKVTMLGIGGYHIGWTEEKDAQAVIELAINSGIRFFDTAHAYGKGESETRFGKYLIPKYRDEIFLMTKSGATDYKTAKEELELSLKRLKTDQVDLWQLHSLNTPEDSENRINSGVLKAVEEALIEKKIKYAGFTCHQNPNAMLKMLELTKSGLFSTAQMPVNVLDANSDYSFISSVMPELIKKEYGILAMKTLADGRFFAKKQLKEKTIWETESPVVPDYVSIEEAMQFTWSMPISTLITGAENAQLLQEKIDFAKRLIELKESDRLALISKIDKYPQPAKVEYYKK